LAGQFELSGSGIKNVALNAAFLAARDGCAVGMPQLLTALKRELYKSGKLLSREDFGEYYMLAE
ncbi:MAG: ATP-binding protein, partial [Oscillospiraceae bacterium]